MAVGMSRRELLARAATGLPWLCLPRGCPAAADDELAATSIATISAGALKVVFRDNSQSPKVLSGLASLQNQQDAPDFDAIDPDSPGASAGLNFEHVISGHRHPNNKFTPREGPFSLVIDEKGKSAELVRKHEHDPWAMSSRLRYSVVAPHYVDFDFRCTPHDAALFGKRGYAILFFANYMNQVQDVAIHFRGIEQAGGPEKWIRADAPPRHADWNQGGTYRSLHADELLYDEDLDFRLNSWCYDYPRFTQPFYFGRADRQMAFELMFDKLHSDRDEIRFSLFKFKVPRFPRPAWDFQYVIHRVQAGVDYGFRGRLVWKKFVSAEDCQAEYQRWRSSVRAG